MRATALFTRTFAAGRRGLVLLAALCFVLSGMASHHTAHALSGGHDAPHPMPADTGDGHCDTQNKPAADTKAAGKFSCCAFACAPLLVLNQTPDLPLVATHGENVQPTPQRLVLSQSPSGLFRPPKQNV